MSPTKPNPWDRPVTPPPPAPTAVAEPPPPPPPPPPAPSAAAAPASPTPLIMMTEMDAYIHERMKGQPTTLAAVEATVQVRPVEGGSRLRLPQDLEQVSYDCTWGDACRVHQKHPETHAVLNPGSLVFRWIMKHKTALDYALNDREWLLVNRAYFPTFPPHLWSTNGGIEIGDAILAFMPAKKALVLRQEPGVRSQEWLRGRVTPTAKNPTRVLMTGDLTNEAYYEPDWGKAESDTVEAGAQEL